MHEYFYGHDEKVAAWIFKKIGMRLAQPYRTMAVVDGRGEIIGGIVYNGYNGANVDMTIYGPSIISRRFSRELATHCFERLQCTRVTARTRRSNKIMCELAPRLGFKYEGTQPRYYGSKKSDDAIIFGMMKEQCIWTSPRLYADHRRAIHGRSGAARSQGNSSGPTGSQSGHGPNSVSVRSNEPVRTVGQSHL